jgi:hypothetical protein
MRAKPAANKRPVKGKSAKAKTAKAKTTKAKTAKAKTLKAYAVQETDENTGSVFFATSNIEARRLGAGQINDGQLGGLTCRRAPWADQYAETGEVPAGAAIANNWHFEDGFTGDTIDEDYLFDHNLKPADVIGTMNTVVFAYAANHAAWTAHQKRMKDARDAAIAEFTALLAKRLPEATPLADNSYAEAHDYSGVIVVDRVDIGFTWPGQKIGPGSFAMRRRSYRDIGPNAPVFYCCHGDSEAFNAFLDAHEKTAKAPA